MQKVAIGNGIVDSDTETEFTKQLAEKMANANVGDIFYAKVKLEGKVNIYPFNQEVKVNRYFKIERV